MGIEKEFRLIFSFAYIYLAVFVICIAALIYMSLRNYKNIDIYYWTLLLFLPVSSIGYFARNIATTQEAAIVANDLIYLDGTFMPAIVLLSTMHDFKIKAPKILKIAVYVVSFLHLGLVWLGTSNGLYYKSVKLQFGPYGSFLTTEPGPLRFLHYVYIVSIILGILAVLIYAWKHPEKCARGTLLTYTILVGSSSAIYGAQVFGNMNYELLPIVYAFSSWFLALSYGRNFSHNIEDIVSTIHDIGSIHGYVAFDLHKKDLCANGMAFSIIPGLEWQSLDKKIDEKNLPEIDFFYQMIEKFEEGTSDTDFTKVGEKTYKYQVSYFYESKNGATKGFLFEISDDTKNRHYLEFVNNYNETLSNAIKSQTANIRAIQSKVVLGLSDMIESRDQNTGSHVKRTSDIIQILVDVMSEKGIGSLNRVLADDIIRAAPMHDLGKISIDNSILCKPGKLTDEEYAIMKTHPVKSGEIVLAILKGVEESHFVSVAYNVARYHHERWDGNGYPEGLAGNDIPLEARVMAVADVYDALVSKRCYKEPMSFKQAYTVMMANMGTQFDPMMESVFMMASPRLEAYYKSLD